MAISRVGFYTSPSSFSTVAATATGVTAGDTLLIGVMWYHSTATISSVTVTSNSAATIRGTKIGPASGVNDANLAWYMLDNVTTGGSLTVTVTFSTPVNSNLAVWDLSGAAATAYDTSASAGETTSANATVSLTAAGNSGALFGISISNGADQTAGSGFTAETTGNQFYYESAEYQLGAGSGSKTIAFTNTSSTWIIHAISLLNDGAAATEEDLTGQALTAAQGTTTPAVSYTL